MFGYPVPVKFGVLYLNPLMVLLVGVVEGDQEQVLDPHGQQVSSCLDQCLLVLRNVVM
jgi:hypothetical protein